MGVLHRFQRTTIISSLLHQLLYALHTFSVKQVHICMVFNALPRITIKLFEKEVYLYFFKKLMITLGNSLDN